jgi:hypothetical protein
MEEAKFHGTSISRADRPAHIRRADRASFEGACEIVALPGQRLVRRNPLRGTDGRWLVRKLTIARVVGFGTAAVGCGAGSSQRDVTSVVQGFQEALGTRSSASRRGWSGGLRRCFGNADKAGAPPRRGDSTQVLCAHARFSSATSGQSLSAAG